MTAAVFAVLLTVVALDRAGLLSSTPGAVGADGYDGVETRVQRVVDGDTLILELIDPETNRPTRVRLWGIDAPETAKDGVPGEPFADEATSLLERLVLNKTVIVVTEPSRERDDFNRLLAHIIADDDTVAAALVEGGLAESVERWRHRDTDRFEALELSARRARKGIWSEGSGR
jgi:micrococcal nuclease